MQRRAQRNQPVGPLPPHPRERRLEFGRSLDRHRQQRQAHPSGSPLEFGELWPVEAVGRIPQYGDPTDRRHGLAQ